MNNSEIEEFTKDCILRYLEDNYNYNLKVEDNRQDDPPDYWIHLNGEKIALEITQANENVLNDRRTFEHSVRNLIEVLDNKYKKYLGDINLVLTINGPFSNYKKDKRLIENRIKDIVLNKQYKINEEIIVNKNIIVKPYVDKLNPGIMALIGFVDENRTVKNSGFYLIKDILEMLLKVKSEKMISIKEEKWLGIFHVEFPFTKISYLQVKDCIREFYNFEKIFIVFKNKEVIQMK